jgi:hypothetical protein
VQVTCDATRHNCRSARLFGQYSFVTIRGELRTANGVAVRELLDPSGGTFDAAGDFDRLLGGAEGLLRYVDPYGDTVFNRVQAPDLIRDIDLLAMAAGVTAVERRGLDRLRIMAEQLRDSVHRYLWFIGD